jgi:hypothetical protein
MQPPKVDQIDSEHAIIGSPLRENSNVQAPTTTPIRGTFPGASRRGIGSARRDIKERGQIEPIILYKGLILDGRNRYRACKVAGVKPRIEEFNAKGSPEDFVLSRNLRRRHLTRWIGPSKWN